MAYYTASILKKSKDVETLGLSLHEVVAVTEEREQAETDEVQKVEVQIAKVSSSFQKKTALVAGLRVLQLNKVHITSVQQANQILQEIPPNHELEIQVQARIVVSNNNNNKNKKDDVPIGLTIVQDSTDPQQCRIRIVEVDPNGRFPTVQVNSMLHAINGQLTSNLSFSKTLELLHQPKTLTLVLLPPPPLPAVVEPIIDLTETPGISNDTADATAGNSSSMYDANGGVPAEATATTSTTSSRRRRRRRGNSRSSSSTASSTPSSLNGEAIMNEAPEILQQQAEEEKKEDTKILTSCANGVSDRKKSIETEAEIAIAHSAASTPPVQENSSDDDSTSMSSSSNGGNNNNNNSTGAEITTPVVLSPTGSNVQKNTTRNLTTNGARAITTNGAVLVEEEKENVVVSIRVVACIIRSSQDMDIGVTLEEHGNGHDDSAVLKIASVKENGLFANTGLEPNMELLKINGHVWSQIRHEKLTKAIDLLKQATGRITLEAMTPNNNNNSNTATNSKQQKCAEKQIFSIQKASPKFSLGLSLSETNGRLQIGSSSPTCEKVLGLKPGLILSKINGTAVSTARQAQELMAKAFPMLSLECLVDANAASTATAPKQPDPDAIKEHMLAQRALLPVTVTPENKKTAKIVRTNIVEVSKPPPTASTTAEVSPLDYWTLAKHLMLNVIVIVDVPETSPIAGKVHVGQVVVSINHTTSAQTSIGTQRQLQKELLRRTDKDDTDDGGTVRIEVGDIQHDHLPSTREEEEMIQAMHQAVRRASTESLEEDEPQQEDVPVLLIDRDQPDTSMEFLDDGASANPASTTVQVVFDEGVQLPKTPKHLAIAPEQKVQWTRSSPPSKLAIPKIVEDSNANKAANNDSDQAQATSGAATKSSQEAVNQQQQQQQPNSENASPSHSNPTASDSKLPSSVQENMEVTAKQVTPSPHSSGSPDRTARQAMFDNVSSRVLFRDGNSNVPASRSENNDPTNKQQHSDVTRSANGENGNPGLVMAPSWGRERRVERDIATIKSQLNMAESALHLAEEHELETKLKLQDQVQVLQQQMQRAKKATEAVEEKVSLIQSDDELRIKAIFEAKKEAEMEVQDLKRQLQAMETDSSEQRERSTAAAEKIKGMLLEVQESCSKAKEEIERMKAEGEKKLKEALDAKSKAEGEVARLSEKLMETEKACNSAKHLLEERRRMHEETVSSLEAKLAAVQQEESQRALEAEKSIRVKAQEDLIALLESQKHDKEEIDVLKKQLVETEGKFQVAQEARKKALQESSALKEQDARKGRSHRKELEKAETEVVKLREQIAAIQSSLQAAENDRQRSMSEVEGLKSDGQVQLKNETEARLRLEKEIVRLEAEVEKSVEVENKAKKILEDKKRDFEKTAAALELKERKNRAMAEEARKKAESIVADISVAETGRLRAEAEVVRTRRTWSLISFLLFLVAFTKIGNGKDHPIQEFVQSVNETIHNFVPDTEATIFRNKLQIQNDHTQEEEARKKKEAAAKAKAEAERKKAKEAQLKAAEEAKQQALAEKATVRESSANFRVGTFQAESSALDELTLLW
eukprot:scaffold3716_cov69-Cylindrotheca_fusiformis.AAC.12